MRGKLLLSCAAASALALAAPSAASAACVSTPGQWTFSDPAGDQWFSPSHSDVAALRVELDAACRLTMEIDVHGSLDPEANLAYYDFEVAGVPGSRHTLYTTLPRPNRPGQEVMLGKPQAGGIGFNPEPGLTVSGVTGWSGTLATLGIETPGELRVRTAAIWEYPLDDTAGGPAGTGDSLPNEPEVVSLPLAFAEAEPPAPSGDTPPTGPALDPAPDPVPPVAPDRTPPTVSGLALRTAALGGARTAGRKALRHATGRYRLSEPAKVAFRLQRRTSRGRYAWLGRSSSHAGVAGANAVRLAGLVSGLRPGAYRLVATARDGAGNRGASRRVGFRVR